MLEHRRALKPARDPVCSVCIANYNGMSTLAACLDSVRQQDCDFEVEVIVHDDASEDDSVAFIRKNYPEVELLVSDENCGFCVSNNRMVDMARGRYVLLLNNDAVLHTDALRSLYEYAERQDTQGILGLPQYDMQDGRLLDRGSRLDPFLNPVPNLERNRRDVGMVIGACLWLPRALWHELGGFPAWFHTLAEDMYLCCAARLWGYPVEVLPVSGFRHWVGKSLGGGKVVGERLRTTLRRRIMSERNKTFVMVLCYPTPLLWLLPLHLVLLLLEGGGLSLVKRDTRLFREIYGHVFAELWRCRRRLKEGRARLQLRRRVTATAFFAPHTWMPYKLRMLWRYGLPRVEMN
ncbi:glycosyltransferase [Candidatus Parcubacteria bacterium]|nr:MAG: glycosyltransferase [Candidatus Parcubacteria bacterium]